MANRNALYPLERQAQVLEERLSLPPSLKAMAAYENAEEKIRRDRMLSPYRRRALLGQLELKKTWPGKPIARVDSVLVM